MDLAIPFPISGRIFEFDSVPLEKFVNFQAGLKTRKPTLMLPTPLQDQETGSLPNWGPRP